MDHDTQAGACSCACHNGPYYACTIFGGCGCDRTNKPGTCITCCVYRPDADPRQPHRPPVCDGDRTLLDRHLGEIGLLIGDLTNPEPPIVDRGRYERFGVEYQGNGRRRPVSLGEAFVDPLAALGGVAPINSPTRQPHVTGSRERPIPIPVTALDLNAPARTPSLAPSPRTPGEPAGGWPEDQIGYLSAATVLDQWVRDTRDTLWPDQHLPAAIVPDLIVWLRNRVDDICDRHPAITEMADSIRALRSALRAAAGQAELQPQLCDGVACPRCNLRTLMTTPGDTYRAQCAGCGTLLTDDEYAQVVTVQDAAERRKRTPEQITDLLRHR